jgi:hypothetical protein
MFEFFTNKENNDFTFPSKIDIDEENIVNSSFVDNMVAAKPQFGRH